MSTLLFERKEELEQEGRKGRALNERRKLKGWRKKREREREEGD